MAKRTPATEAAAVLADNLIAAADLLAKEAEALRTTARILRANVRGNFLLGDHCIENPERMESLRGWKRHGIRHASASALELVPEETAYAGKS